MARISNTRANRWRKVSSAMIVIAAVPDLPNHYPSSRAMNLSRLSAIFSLTLLLGVAVVPALLNAAEAAPAVALERFANNDCLNCHTDATLTKKVLGKDVPLTVVQTNALEKSVHTNLLCVDCHNGIKELVHESGLPPAQCVSCHENQPDHERAAKEYAGSIHGVSRAMGASGAPECADCHGTHNILSAK